MTNDYQRTLYRGSLADLARYTLMYAKTVIDQWFSGLMPILKAQSLKKLVGKENGSLPAIIYVTCHIIYRNHSLQKDVPSATAAGTFREMMRHLDPSLFRVSTSVFVCLVLQIFSANLCSFVSPHSLKILANNSLLTRKMFPVQPAHI